MEHSEKPGAGPGEENTTHPSPYSDNTSSINRGTPKHHHRYKRHASTSHRSVSHDRGFLLEKARIARIRNIMQQRAGDEQFEEFLSSRGKEKEKKKEKGKGEERPSQNNNRDKRASSTPPSSRTWLLENEWKENQDKYPTGRTYKWTNQIPHLQYPRHVDLSSHPGHDKKEVSWPRAMQQIDTNDDLATMVAKNRNTYPWENVELWGVMDKKEKIGWVMKYLKMPNDEVVDEELRLAIDIVKNGKEQAFGDFLRQEKVEQLKEKMRENKIKRQRGEPRRGAMGHDGSAGSGPSRDSQKAKDDEEEASDEDVDGMPPLTRQKTHHPQSGNKDKNEEERRGREGRGRPRQQLPQGPGKEIQDC